LLSEALEQVGDDENAWFVDLFVRVENEAAIKLYKKMGSVLSKHPPMTHLESQMQ
jgi:ribosomal protein S18 acetylase RimI-like enzyme